MITYKDSNNAEKYTVLFRKASAKLGLMPIIKEVLLPNGEKDYEYYKREQVNGEWTERLLDAENPEDKAFIDGETSREITSLNEYFQNITQLAALAIGEGRHGSDPYFLRLPLDEPFLEINANTRVINVPSELRQIGVRGDKYAEVVFFKIDRYFDAVDLATRHIYIEWEAPDGQGGVKKGVSRDFLKDIQSEKDKLIFGWVIGEELTEYIGNIRFAVRFVEWVEKEDSAVNPGEGRGLQYSFSSLPAQMTIVDSLNYSLFEDDEEAQMINTEGQGGTILYYLEDSIPDSADETEPENASIPVFVRNLRDINGASLVNDVYEADLEESESGLKLRLMVEASPNGDAGNISYIFAKKAMLSGDPNGLPAKIKFLDFQLASAADVRENTTYYKKLANETYEVVSTDDLDFSEGPITLYEKVAYVDVSLPGYYFAKAKNSVSGFKPMTANSDILYVPYASAPVVTTEIPARFVINERNYSLDKDQTVDQTTKADKDKSNIKIVMGDAGPSSIILGAQGTENVPAIGPIFSAAKSKGLSYTWYKDGVAIDNAHEPTLEVSQPGIYSASVVNSYNNDTKEITKEEVGSIRVTNMPVIPEVRWDKWAQVLLAGRVDEYIEVCEEEHDEISYQWYRVTRDNDDMDPIAEGDMAQDHGIIEFHEVAGEPKRIGHIPFKPLHQGNYYFILKNELNGASIYMNCALDINMGVIAVENSGSENPTPPQEEPVTPTPEEPENPDNPTEPTDEPTGE